MDSNMDATMLLVGVAVDLAGVVAILGGLLVVDWLAGRRRRQRARVEANPDAGRELVSVGGRVRRNWRRYR
jgi:hypothetical protein